MKRKLSSIEEIPRKAVGRKMDSIYVGAELELGALEIGSRKNDDTKDLRDGYFKLPIVMKDMLKNIIDKYPSLVNDISFVGYNIQGKYVKNREHREDLVEQHLAQHSLLQQQHVYIFILKVTFAKK